MNIWIISEGEPVPPYTSSGRLMRAGLFATKFSELGSEVIWWCSTYAHYEKRYLFNENTVQHVSDNLKIMMLHSRNGYSNNISIKRILYSKDLANEFREKAKLFKKPDIIYCSWPLIDLCYEAVKYGELNDIPVVLDIRDLWPDIFIQPFSKILQPAVKFLVDFIFKKNVTYVMKNATSVIAVVPEFLKFAEKYDRVLKQEDHVVFLSYDKTPESENEIIKAKEFWKNFGLSENQCIVSFIGTISNRVCDFDTLVEAAKLSNDTSIKFVFCGTGNYLEELTKQCASLENVILPGYRNKAELQELLKMSTYGLLSYRNTEDFIDHLPNKVGEYLSEGLIIPTSLKGASKRLIEEKECGFYYDSAYSLIKKIKQINDSKVKKKQMSENALNLFYKEFDANKVYPEFYKYLEKLATTVNFKGENINYE